MTKHQEIILEEMKNGVKLDCTEGVGYKTWLIYPDGSKKTIRRDTAEKICEVHMDNLNFDNDGISWRVIK